MPARRGKAGGLTDEDVARLRDQLGQGRRPRVQLSGPQFDAGASGAVVRIGDPVVDGADYLTVRVKVNGQADELAFAPAELSLRRGTARPAATGPAATGPAATGPVPARQPRTAVSPGMASGTPDAEPVTPAGAPTAPDAQLTAPSGRRRKAAALPPKVTVSISSAGASWSVSASRGAKAIAKNVPIAPGVVTAIVGLLGQPGVADAVADINETARVQAQQRADELRAELSSLEAVLATHRSPR